MINCALSNYTGTAEFNHVITNPSYSGLLKRDYDHPNEKDEKITVKVNLLDEVVPITTKIDLIKIDVEGAEYLVLQGAKKTIQKWKPTIIFEHGLGASDKYGFGPDDMFELLASFGLHIFNLSSFLKGKKSLSKEEFGRQYWKKVHYYFVAAVSSER